MSIPFVDVVAGNENGSNGADSKLKLILWRNAVRGLKLHSTMFKLAKSKDNLLKSYAGILSGGRLVDFSMKLFHNLNLLVVLVGYCAHIL